MSGSHSSSGSNTQQKTDQNGYTIPIVPDAVAAPLGSYLGTVGGLISGASDPNVARSLVPGASAAQTAAYNGATALGTPSLFGQAGDAASRLQSGVTSAGASPAGAGLSMGSSPVSAAMMSSSQAAPLIGQFENPYINNVVNSTLAVQGNQNAQQLAHVAAQNGTSGAFGGSRYGATQANLMAQQGLANSQLASGLYGNAYNSALGAAQTQAGQDQAATAANQAAYNNMGQFNANQSQQNQQFNAGQMQNTGQFNANLGQQNQQFNAGQQQQALQQAASLFGSLGTAQNNAANQNIATQLAAGQDQRGIQSQQNTSQLNYLSALQQLLGVNPESLFGSQTTANSVVNQNSSTSGTSFGIKLGG